MANVIPEPIRRPRFARRRGPGPACIAPRPRRTSLVVAALWCAAMCAVAYGTGSAAPQASTNARAADSTVALDGAVYGQPIVAGDNVYAATENGTVYAVSNSAVRWSTHVADPISQSALPCGNIDPEGITGRPAFDGAAHRLYVVAETSDAHHVLYGLDSDSGAVTMQLTIDPPFGDSPSYLQRPALVVANGRVFAAFGGNWGTAEITPVPLRPLTFPARPSPGIRHRRAVAAVSGHPARRPRRTDCCTTPSATAMPGRGRTTTTPIRSLP
ncbi:PQQ-binding-like beta-propeller repeat protein [Nocardia arthritidis]|uniref:PQQ-binding-like beta-propeller repeat protein n=1 Tax=Nocardia arthritidis TaxID=228602 RepID=A0A6G9YES3_9NOCA|nr:PQQ-binding-like beta-propeller repeat protein [Nocardia arthritidis]QIS11577.1 PQQ-binding-like beta-propeller repeat protein [Nocardia arthritidis]